MNAAVPQVSPLDEDAGALDIRQPVDDAECTLAPLDQARRAFEREYLVRILTLTRGNVTHAARLAGRNRTEFYRLLERHALEPSMFKQAG